MFVCRLDGRERAVRGQARGGGRGGSRGVDVQAADGSAVPRPRLLVQQIVDRRARVLLPPAALELPHLAACRDMPRGLVEQDVPVPAVGGDGVAPAADCVRRLDQLGGGLAAFAVPDPQRRPGPVTRESTGGGCMGDTHTATWRPRSSSMACLRFVAAPLIVSHRTNGKGTSSEPSAIHSKWGSGEEAGCGESNPRGWCRRLQAAGVGPGGGRGGATAP